MRNHVIFSLCAAAFMVIACTGTGTEETGPSVRITAPADGGMVMGPDVNLTIAPSGFTGHFHVYLDRPPEDIQDYAIPAGTTAITMTGLASGPHYVIVTGNDVEHSAVAGVYDSAAFTVP